MVRIVIADDHEVVRSGLRTIISTRADWEVVAEAADGKDALAKILAAKPDIAILDYGLPTINGVELTRQVRSRCPDTEVLMFTMRDEDSIVERALEAGARAYLLKSEASQFLLSAIESLAQHKAFFTGHSSEKLLHAFLNPERRRDKSLLSPRERLVVQLIAEGRSNKEMSDILNVSVKTIEAQRSAAMKKLDLTTTAAIVRYAIREKLIEP
ncbi:response regulator [Bradyrhizobium stylosanthis]|uniref:LuxR family two component transcriptional regulator n=1 Tax=Bradyrhizobium stylosanthis TaxID=1803665 RepID=A0A560D5F2_9BRAD|nr:response regulator transcription factor [Bradyrhizobium stylosanthis]TWA92329.1 LuxR family two component transcriptional regulator [Bradyrhizobium stylosanthis]